MRNVFAVLYSTAHGGRVATNACRFFIYLTLVFSIISTADAGGAYQRTKDGKTSVWNNAPAPGDSATWSGERDAAGYATGPGTLTWFTATPVKVTGTNIPSAKHAKLSRYTGKMARGKFEGMVTAVDADGTTYHGIFADGHKTKDWSPGAATAEVEKSKARPRTETASQSPVAKPRPSATPKSTPPVEAPVVEKTPVEPPRHVDDSLQSLTMPPPSLRTNVSPAALPETASTPSAPAVAARPRLRMEEVISLADGEARAKGYKLNDFERLEAKYTPADDSWSVSYGQKASDGAPEANKHFSVDVADKTKKASLAPAK